MFAINTITIILAVLVQWAKYYKIIFPFGQYQIHVYVYVYVKGIRAVSFENVRLVSAEQQPRKTGWPAGNSLIIKQLRVQMGH